MRSCSHFLLSILLCVSADMALAGSPASEIVGVWEIVSYDRYNAETNETTFPLGRNPTGHIIYTASGYVSVVITGGGRTSVEPTDDKRDEKQSTLLSTMIAYSGTYKVQDDTIVHHVESAWLPGQVGTDQKRYFTLDRNKLSLKTAPFKNPFDGKTYTYLVKLKRVP